MTLWILVGGMICIVVGALVLPSLMPRTRVSAVRDEFDLAVYKDQLNGATSAPMKPIPFDWKSSVGYWPWRMISMPKVSALQRVAPFLLLCL